jgi:cell wall-associated NlpC family hydrolase
MQLKNHVLNAIKEHAIEEYPKEALGLIVDGEYLRCTNISPDPINTFELKALEYLQAKSKGEIQALIHSHTHQRKSSRFAPNWPSLMDMTEWLKGTIPWGIIAVDDELNTSEILWLEENNSPLEGRRFSHGASDCYGLIRDYYRMVLGISLRDYPRDFEWWNKNEDLYSQNFAREGFFEISENELKEHDCILFKYHSPVVNHAAVYVGDGDILHQLMGRMRLSAREKLQRYQSSIVKYLRHENMK